MTLEDKFNQVIEKWMEHCSQPSVLLDSSGTAIKDCDAYKELVAMGKKALPLIRQAYDRDGNFYFHAQDEQKGDIVISSTKDLARNKNFMEGLRKFQYGETAEESNAGFEQIEGIMRGQAENDPLSIIKSLGLVDLVNDIVGSSFRIPKKIQGRMGEIAEYTKQWLDKNMKKYQKD